MRGTRKLALVIVAVTALAAGACGDDGDDDDAAGAAGGQTEPAADTAVALGDTDLGKVLVDGDGDTLYIFTNDTDGKSNCNGTCAQTWPPLSAPDEVTGGEGVDASLLGTTTRDDGSKQVTYGGAPLYTYAKDAEPGDTTGQGVGGVWFVVDADGEAVRETASASGGFSY